MLYLYKLLKLLPKNFISYVTGCIARLKLPRPFSIFVNTLFVKLFKIDMSEAEHPISFFDSVECVFTRTLKPGQRIIDGGMVSPADGILAKSLPVEQDTAIQAKGLNYSTHELIGTKQTSDDKAFDAAWFSTVYLAPHNYHRVHSPITGLLKGITYIPGQLWPVNKPFVAIVPKLFCKNERLVFEIEEESGGSAFIVMVGALNVGRIESKYWPSMTSNDLKRQFQAPKRKTITFSEAHKLNAGDELGVFMLGSTVVSVFDAKIAEKYALKPVSEGLPVKMGQSTLA